MKFLNKLCKKNEALTLYYILKGTRASCLTFVNVSDFFFKKVAKKLAGMKKLPYLCTRKREKGLLEGLKTVAQKLVLQQRSVL